MEAKTQYNDFKGTTSADISDVISMTYRGESLNAISKYFRLDEDRFQLIGICLYKFEGSEFKLDFLCKDKENSTEQEEKIVKLYYDKDYDEKNILDILFKRLSIVLYDRFDERCSKMENCTEISFSECH